MPTWEHEFPLDLIRNAPDLAAKLLGHATGKPLPPFARARCDSSEATTTAPAELLCDSVVVLEDDTPGPHTPPLAAIIVENQRNPDHRKNYSWPAYVATLRHRLHCPVKLLVLTPTQSLAHRCAEPIDLGCGELRPVTLSTTALRPIREREEATRTPELAVLAAAIHRTDDPQVINALPDALDVIDPHKRSKYSDRLYAALPAAALKLLEEAVITSNFEWKSDLARESRTAGKAEGKAETVVAILTSRGFTIPNGIHQHITECADLNQLDTWAQRAATITHIDDLLA